MKKAGEQPAPAPRGYAGCTPFVKMTCDVASARCAAPRAMPIERGIHAGRGVAWNSRRQPALSASTDHVCGGNMSLTLLAAIGCTISVHAR